MKRSAVIVAVITVLASLLVGSPAIAQDSPSPGAGITATGYGHASAPAASAEVQLLIQFDTVYGGAGAAGVPPAAAVPPGSESTPGSQVLTLLDPLVQHVRTVEGVDRAEAVVPLVITPYKDPTILGRIDVTVSEPTRERLVTLYGETSRVAFDYRMMVGYVGAAFTPTDCSALEREARQAALDDAGARATLQAELLDVELGAVVASADVPPATGPPAMDPYGYAVQTGGACDPPTRPVTAVAQPYPGVTLPPFDPNAHTGQVDVYRQVRVTWAIAPAGG